MSITIQKIRLGREITVAMSAYGNYEATRQALNALLTCTEGDFELILVDDCSPDNTLSLFLELKEQRPNTRVFSFSKNLEYSGSLNAILSHAAGQWILFLSNDILVTPAYLREIFRVAGAQPSGIIRGCSNFVDNGLQTHNISPSTAIDTLEKLFGFAEHVATRFSGQYLMDSYLTGDAFLVSRRTLDRIGALDPQFYGYFADHDLGIRARIAGHTLVLARGAYAMHLRNANFEYLPEKERELKLSARWMKVFENWARFKMKYGLPVELPYTGTNDIPWDDLCSEEFSPIRHYCPPADFSAYLL